MMGFWNSLINNFSLQCCCHALSHDSIMPNPIGQAVLVVIMYVKTYTTDIIVFIGKVIMWIDLILFMVFNATNV
jgi:hypothetical protein